jgi:hypothetical protein
MLGVNRASRKSRFLAALGMTASEDKAKAPATVRGRYTPLSKKRDHSKRRQSAKQDGEINSPLQEIRERNRLGVTHEEGGADAAPVEAATGRRSWTLKMPA